MKLLSPRFVALDTSHLTQWLRDRTSDHAEDRGRAGAFEEALDARGAIPTLCLHHIQELIQFDDLGAVERRLRSLAAISCIGWIASGEGQGPGTVVSVLTEEVRAAAQQLGATPQQVSAQAKSRLLKFGPAEEVLGRDPGEWLRLRPYAKEMEVGSRVNVGITRSNVIDVGQKPFSELIAGSLRSPKELGRILAVMLGSLAADLRRKGDHRLDDPEVVAAQFLSEVLQNAGSVTSVDELIRKCLAMQGLSPDEITPSMTVAQVTRKGMFRMQLKLVAENLGLSIDSLKGCVKEDQLPVWIISEGLREHSQDPTERTGSELTDIALVCLSPYVDLVLVDKRTMQNVIQARHADPAFRTVVGVVEKASRYNDVPAILDRLAAPEAGEAA